MKKKFVVLLLLLAAAGLAFLASEALHPHQGYEGKVIVDVPPRMHTTQVADLLVAKGILARRLPFLAICTLGHWRYHLKAGTYLFDRPLRPVDVFRKLARGQVYLRTVVIPEGSNRFQIARILQERLGIAPDDFFRATQETSAIQDLDSQAPSLEGYLFPDTYQFEYHASAAHVALEMVARFRQVLRQDFEQNLNRPTMDLHKIITLASLVEDETPNPRERPIVAQVFELRLKKGMPLQCDPTVLYAMELAHRPVGAITASDLELQSPYNTYLHPGLPPGPISNPGKASIAAVLNPAPTRFLYFVSNNHGGHSFARTLAEHRRNVARYREETATRRLLVRDEARAPSRAHHKQR